MSQGKIQSVGVRVSVACAALLLADETRTARLMSGTDSRVGFSAAACLNLKNVKI